PTDINWFLLLRDFHDFDEINFWTPTPWNIKQLKDGDRLYFMLKDPIRRIGGYGTFVRYENARASDAWAKYGLANGTESLAELNTRLTGYVSKNSKRYAPTTDPTIGCIVLRDPVFFDDDALLDPVGGAGSF